MTKLLQLFFIFTLFYTAAFAKETGVFVQSGGEDPTAVVFSKDDSILVTVDKNNMLYVWDAATGQEVNRVNLFDFKSDLNLIRNIYFTSNPDHVVLDYIHGYLLIDVEQNILIRDLSDSSVEKLFQNYSDYLYDGGMLYGADVLFSEDVYEGKKNENQYMHEGGHVATISQDGSVLMVNDYDLSKDEFTWTIYRTKDWQILYVYKNTSGYTLDELSNNGRYGVVYKSNPSTFKISYFVIDFKTQKKIKSLDSETIKWDPVFSSDSSKLYYSDFEDKVFCLDLISGDLEELKVKPGPIAVKNHTSNQFLMGSTLLDAATSQSVMEFKNTSSTIEHPSFHENALLLHDQNHFFAFDPTSSSIVNISDKMSGNGISEFISSRGKRKILHDEEKKTLTIVSTDNAYGKFEIEYDGKYDYYDFSPDETRVLLGFKERETSFFSSKVTYTYRLQIWDIQKQKMLHEFEANQLIHATSFLGEETIMFNMYEDNKWVVKTWNIPDRKEKDVTPSLRQAISAFSAVDPGSFSLVDANEKYICVFETRIIDDDYQNPEYHYYFMDSKRYAVVQHLEVKSDSSPGFQDKSFISPDSKYYIDFNHGIYDLEDDMRMITKLYSGSRLRLKPAFSDDGFLMAVSKGDYVELFNLKTGNAVKIYSFGKEWVAVNEDGYFTGSEGAQKHLKVRNADGSISSLDQYYDTYYRPDIVMAALQGEKVSAGPKLAEVKPAPSVEIVNTAAKTDKPEIEVTLKLTDQGGGIGDIRLFVNGTAVKSDKGRGLKPQKEGVLKTYTIALANGENTIKAIAYNADNTMNSREALHKVVAAVQSDKPNLYAIVIGINQFKNPALNLNFAVPDANLFAETLKKHSGDLFGTIQVELLTVKSNTDKNTITEALKNAQKLKPNDLFVFYVASHGTVDDGEYFLITSNVGSVSTRKLKQNALRQDELKALIANIPTQKKMIVLDTCNSQAMGDAIQVAVLSRGMSESTAMKVLSRAVGSTVLSASTSTQIALEGYKGHGLFTYIITEGMTGKADADKDGFVKTTELANYIDDEVPAIAEKVFNWAQYPTVAPSGQAFPVTKVK
jgi:hypothetical protein